MIFIDFGGLDGFRIVNLLVVFVICHPLFYSFQLICTNFIFLRANHLILRDWQLSRFRAMFFQAHKLELCQKKVFPIFFIAEQF